jgi:hypothetical protein
MNYPNNLREKKLPCGRGDLIYVHHRCSSLPQRYLRMTTGKMLGFDVYLIRSSPPAVKTRFNNSRTRGIKYGRLERGSLYGVGHRDDSGGFLDWEYIYHSLSWKQI